MARDDEADEQGATVREGPRWNLTTAVVAPRGRQEVTRGAEPTEVVERFDIGEELGRGGMGSVVAAVDRVLEREVAIKHALSDDAEMLRLFQREAKITAQLEHPAIVPVHDAGYDQDGKPYYVMRRLDGESLAKCVERRRDVKARLALVPNVLAAVDAAAFADAHGVIHRDIKPWNILIGDYGETLLIDWGLARLIDEPDEQVGRSVGTPGAKRALTVRLHAQCASAQATISIGAAASHA